MDGSFIQNSHFIITKSDVSMPLLTLDTSQIYYEVEEQYPNPVLSENDDNYQDHNYEINSSKSPHKALINQTNKKLKRESNLQKYLIRPEFEGWLTETQCTDKALCLYCNCELLVGKYELNRHAKSKKHIKNAQLYGRKDVNISNDNLESINSDIKKILKNNLKNDKRYKKQLFSKKWLTLPEFKDWLVESLSLDKAGCLYCKTEIIAGKSELQRHAKSKKHIDRSKIYQTKCINNKTSMNLEIVNYDAEIEEVLLTQSAIMTKVVDLRSDSMSTPNFGMKQAIVEASAGDTSYNTDKTVSEFEKSVAEMLNKEAGLFFPSHSMANLVAIMSHCRSRGSAVIFGDKSDICLNNQEALFKFGGLSCRSLANKPDGSFSVDEYEEMAKTLDRQYFQNLVCIELPHYLLGGVVPDIDWLNQVEKVSKHYGVLIHCDGTRLANASIYLSIPSSTIVNYCDSVTFAIDKSLGAPFGAVLVGDKNFIKRCEFIRNSIGGHIHQAGLFAAVGSYVLKTLPSIQTEHNTAWNIALTVSKFKNKYIYVSLDSLHTNIVHLKCDVNILNAKELVQRLSCVNEEELHKWKDDTVLILAEEIDNETVALRIHKDITEKDAMGVIMKLKYITEELADKDHLKEDRRRSRNKKKFPID